MNKDQRIGQFITYSENNESYKSYIPKPLPPQPPIVIENFYSLLDKAVASLGKLNGIKTSLPDDTLLLMMFAKKEALLSSQIEGTQSSFSDILILEEEEQLQNDDSKEVFNYIKAMEHGLKSLEKLPLSRRLLCEMHEILLSSGRGKDKTPGQFRTTQNWIGGTRPGNALFVPPSPDNLEECFSDFEKFLNNKNILLPALIKVALAHVQFETIHPFLDGNGRLGRLLITFMLRESQLLEEGSFLYLSLYFKQNKTKYYDLLQSVRLEGDWEAWIEFFLKGIQETSDQMSKTTQNIIDLFEKDEKKISSSGKDTKGVSQTYRYLKKQPVSNIKNISKNSNISMQTVVRSLKTLQEIGIIEKLKKIGRNKIVVYKNYLHLLHEGTEMD